MNQNQRTLALAGLLVVVGAFVLYDRAARSSGGGDSSSPADELAARSAEIDRQRALVAAGPEWERALAEARGAWERVRSSSALGATPELAVEAFRSRLVEEARALGLTVDSVQRAESAPVAEMPGNAERLHTLEVRFTVTTHRVEDVYRLLDRIEHMPGLRAHVSESRITGPGAIQRTQKIAATFTARAIGITPAAGGGA